MVIAQSFRSLEALEGLFSNHSDILAQHEEKLKGGQQG